MGRPVRYAVGSRLITARRNQIGGNSDTTLSRRTTLAHRRQLSRE